MTTSSALEFRVLSENQTTLSLRLSTSIFLHQRKAASRFSVPVSSSRSRSTSRPAASGCPVWLCRRPRRPAVDHAEWPAGIAERPRTRAFSRYRFQLKPPPLVILTSGGEFIFQGPLPERIGLWWRLRTNARMTIGRLSVNYWRFRLLEHPSGAAIFPPPDGIRPGWPAVSRLGEMLTEVMIAVGDDSRLLPGPNPRANVISNCDAAALANGGTRPYGVLLS